MQSAMFSPNKKCWLANAGLRVRFATAIIVTRIIIIVNSRTEIGRIKWNQAMPDFLQHQRGKARREPDRNTQPEMPAFAAYGGAMQGENRRKRSVSAAGTALLLGLATASVAADLLPTHAGRLDAGSHRQHTVQTAAGDYVHGRISGNGMLLTLQDEQGRPVRVHLEAGLYNGQSGIRDTTRQLRDVLTAKGYTVSHREYAAAHGFEHWRTSFAEGLLTLLGCRQAAPPCRLANN